MSKISTHVLDTGLGKPAAGLPVSLYFQIEDKWKLIAQDTTNDQGRSSDLFLQEAGLALGSYRLTFETRVYFKRLGTLSFFPHVGITFEVDSTSQNYHIPLLLSAFGYSTYRGS